jgi:hypothetical protein
MAVPATQHNTSQHQLVTDTTLNITVAVIRTEKEEFTRSSACGKCIVAVWYAEG